MPVLGREPGSRPGHPGPQFTTVATPGPGSPARKLCPQRRVASDDAKEGALYHLNVITSVVQDERCSVPFFITRAGPLALEPCEGNLRRLCRPSRGLHHSHQVWRWGDAGAAWRCQIDQPLNRNFTARCEISFQNPQLVLVFGFEFAHRKAYWAAWRSISRFSVEYL